MNTAAMNTVAKSYSRQLARTGNYSGTVRGFQPERMPWLPQDKNALIVDLGCGWGQQLRQLRQLGYNNLVGVEGDQNLATEVGEQCGNGANGIRIIHSDAIEFLERTSLVADRITLFHVLEHFSPSAGERLLSAARARLHPKCGQIVIEVPNMSSLTGPHMRYTDLTHMLGFTEFNLRQLLDNTGFEEVSVICGRPRLGLWRIGQQGSGLAWHANRWLHRAVYSLTNAGPRPTCYCAALLVTAK
jgi:2-polyprenyl-3-methyl-5-hydroxy-6-metoxy-1,4-benzoquinol methylase